MVLSRNRQYAGNRTLRDRYHRARAAFAKQGGFRGLTGSKGHTRREALACKTALGKSCSQAAIAHVVRRANRSLGCERGETFDEAPLGGNIHGWRRACHNACNYLGVLG